MLLHYVASLAIVGHTLHFSNNKCMYELAASMPVARHGCYKMCALSSDQSWPPLVGYFLLVALSA